MIRNQLTPTSHEAACAAYRRWWTAGGRGHQLADGFIAGGHYKFGWGTSSDKLAAPALTLDDLPPIDTVLLTHDHHGDNLDHSGRTLLPNVSTIVTTVSGSQRLGLPQAVGLRPGMTTTLRSPGLPDVQVQATPARHGPPLTRFVAGEVIGFALRRPHHTEAFLWITGDTVLHRRLRRTATALQVDVALVHVGGVQFPVTGPIRYTMTAHQAVQLIGLNSPASPYPPTTRAGRTSSMDATRLSKPSPQPPVKSAAECTGWRSEHPPHPDSRRCQTTTRPSLVQDLRRNGGDHATCSHS